MDLITNRMLDEFSKSAGIEKYDPSSKFEHFTAYLTIAQHYPDDFKTEDVVIGNGDDTGIDAIAIIVNNNLVVDTDDLDELLAGNKHIDVELIFVQSETSDSFDGSKMSNFAYGVADFFRDTPRMRRNDDVKRSAEIAKKVYDNFNRFTENPKCILYYATTGRWTSDHNLETRMQGIISELSETNLFRSVEFIPIGASDLQKLYRLSQNAISRDFLFPDRTVIPEMPGVEQAFLGHIDALTVISLIEDESGNIIKSLFSDNVRDYQGQNAVNSKIKETIESNDDKRRFALMNNGITIIAKRLKVTNHRFYIEDYQIVNGCQTSHVLFEERLKLDASIRVPLRLIATDDEEVTSAIVRATNSQTALREEQFLALNEFHKSLEEYFASFPDPYKLYYERRSRQYNGITHVEKARIVTVQNLIRSFASFFLNDPHRTTRNFTSLRDQAIEGSRIFGSDHKLSPYYLSAFALYRLEYLFRNSPIDSKFRAARYHLLMASRILLETTKVPWMNSRQMDTYCRNMIDTFWDVDRSSDIYHKAIDIVSQAAANTADAADRQFHRDNIRTQPFTAEVTRLSQLAKQGNG